jgi:hypothetical protein
MKKCVLVVTLLFLLSILAFAACSQYATCPQDGETAAMIDSGPENGGFVATYAHTHKDSMGNTYHHTFKKACSSY